MTVRTVTVRLRLDSSQWGPGSRAAGSDMTRMAARAQAAGAAAERSAQRTAQSVSRTFAQASRQGQTAIRGLEQASVRSSQAAAAASRATSQASLAAAQGTRRVQQAAAALPATFRAAEQAGVSSLQTMTQAALTNRQAVAQTALANRQAVTVASGAVTQASQTMQRTTAASQLGLSRVSLASRIAVEQQRAAARAAATTWGVTVSQARAASGAFAQASVRARAMGTTLAAASARSQRSLGAARTTSLALVAAIGLAVYASSRFEKAMSGVKAATQAGTRELAKLRAAAIEAGRSTQYSATQAAEGETELAKAGVSTADILGGALKGTLNLAAAGQMDVADSAVVAAKAMNSFGLQGSDMAHIADVIAAAAGKSATDVHGMSLAFAQASLLAHQTGLTLEQTAGSLALFAQNGLVGSDAGTSLKTMLLRLTPQSKEAAAMMDRLGFSAYDSNGNFVGLSETARRMQKSFGSLTPEARNAALATIFGSDAARAATVVYKAGAEGIDAWTKAANDQGYASKYAATQTDNLAGDLQRLKSALETAIIEGGSGANEVLRGLAQSLTTVIKWWSKLPTPVQESAIVLAGVAGAIGLVGTSMLLMLPRVRTARTELQALGVTSARTGAAMAALGRASLVVAGLTAISYASAKLTDVLKDAPPDVAKLTNSLVDLAQGGHVSGEAAKAFGENLDGVGEAVARIAHPSVLKRVDDVLYSITHLGMSDQGNLEEARDKISALDQSLTSLVQSGNSDVAASAFARMATEANASGTSTEKLKTLLPQYTDALAGVDTQTKLSAGSQGDLADAADTTADALQDQRTEAEKLTDALDALNGKAISAAEAQIDFRQSLHDLGSAVKDNGHSLNVSSEAGRKVKTAFLDAAKAAQAHAQAVAEQKNSQKAGQKVLQEDIALLKGRLKQLGFSDAAIKTLIGTYAKLPPKKTVQVVTEAEQAKTELQAVQTALAATTDKSVTVKALTAGAEHALTNLGFTVTHMKDGTVRVSVPTGTPKANAAAIQSYIDSLHGTTLTVTTQFFRKATKGDANADGIPDSIARANGGVLSYYADGGVRRERHVAQIARAGSWRVWGEPETGGESYIPLAPSKRGRSRAIAEETVRRLGGKGIAWYASGGFTYSPTGAPALGGPGDAQQRYDDLVSKLKDAWKEYAEAQKELAKVSKGKHTKAELQAARKKVAEEYADVTALDKALGLSRGAKAPSSFNLKAYQVQLGKSLAATEKWRTNLAKIGKRGGAEVQALLEGMGEDGYALVNSLAGASDRQFADIVKKLQKTGAVAKATLADFNKQLGASTRENKQFSADLQKLAAEGFGDLAQMLAAQGDDAAMALAHQAAGSSKDAAKANAAVGKSKAVLTGDDLTNALTLLSTLRGAPGRGYADLIAAGLDTATIKALVPKMATQIKALPAQYTSTFIRQWTSQGGTALARGGILTRPTMALAGEAGPESYIPWNNSARSTGLLARTASALGYQLVPAGRYAGGGGGTAAAAQQVSRSTTVVLQGAKQSAAEQAADIARVINFVG